MATAATARSKSAPPTPHPHPRAQPAPAADPAVAAAAQDALRGSSGAGPATAPAPGGVPGSVALQATLSSTPPQPKATAKPEDHPHLWRIRKKFEWKGEPYELTLYLYSDEDKISMSESEKTKFPGEADDLAEMFAAELLKQLNAQQQNSDGMQIIPGDSCKVLIKDGEIVIVDEAVNINDLDNPESLQGKKVIVAKNGSASALAKAACAGNAEDMRKSLAHEDLKEVRAQVSKERIEKSASAGPASLRWKENSCFFDAPLQVLLTDQKVAQDLDNPDFYVDGEKNGLYKVVKEYRNAQRSGKPLDAASILRDKRFKYHLDNSGNQMDAVGDGWNSFEKFFDFSSIPEDSHLHSLFEDPVIIGVQTQSGTLSDLATAALGDKDDEAPSDVICIQTDRLKYTPQKGNLSDHLTEKERRQFGLALRSQLPDKTKGLATNQRLIELELNTLFSEEAEPLSEEDYDSCYDTLLGAQDNEALELLKRYYHSQLLEAELNDLDDNLDLENLPKKDEVLSSDGVAVIQAILDNEKLRLLAFELLTLEQKKPIHAKLKPTFEKATKAVTIDPSGKATIKGKAYDIVSFVQHEGGAEGGHYLAYVRTGGKCYKLDDLQKSKKEITLDAFVEAAGTASLYVLHKEDPTVSAAATTETGRKTAEKDTFIVKREAEKLFSTTVEVGTYSSMKEVGIDFVLVHPSDLGLQLTPPELTAVVKQAQIGAATKARNSWFSTTYKPRRFNIGPSWLSGPNMLLTAAADGRQIVHIPLKDEFSKDATQEDVEQAIEDILTFVMEHTNSRKVAIPAFAKTDWMESGVQRFLEKNVHKWRGGHIRIILHKEKEEQPPVSDPVTSEPPKTPSPAGKSEQSETSSSADESERPIKLITDDSL